jgi:tetratricopeptide (TPR) repeat protein
MAAADLLEDLLAEQRRRWQDGEPAPVEEYLGRHPALANDPEAVLDLIYNEVFLREQHGDPPRLEEYLSRFPYLADQVRAQFDVHHAFPVEAEDAGAAPVQDTRVVGSEGGPLRPQGEREEVSGYEVLRELGRGSMGVVFEARQLALKRPVALKMMRGYGAAAPEVRARFRTEAEAVARLQHANIVQVYEVGEHDGEPFISLELVGGQSLAQRLAGTPQPPRAAAELCQTLARAMAHAHRQGIVHRDLKPGNVLLTPDGTPKITDFGLAKLLDSDTGQTRSEAFLGTPSYMAPEQARGDARGVGPAADVYALGAILYECLTGRPPFRGTTVLETAEQVRSQDPVPPRRLQPGVPRDLETVCLKCLEKQPHRRYAGAAELADDLRRFLAGETVQARPTTAWHRAVKWARRRPAAAALIAVSLLAVLSLGGLALRQRQLWVDRARLDARERYRRFIQGRDTALFSKIYGQGLDPVRSLQEMQATGDDALAAVTGADGALAASPYWTEAEKAEVRSGSYELLLVMADAFLQPGPAAGPPQPDQALRCLDRAARLGPVGRAYHERRGRCLGLLGQEAAAAREAELAGSDAEVTAADSFLEGDLRFQWHDLGKAAQAFNWVLGQQPDHFWAQYYLAFCDLEEEHYGEALARLTALLGRRPDFVWTRLLRGLASTQLHATDAAEADFAAAEQLHPEGEALYALHVHRGGLNVERKRFAEATDDLRQAVALQPDRHQAYKGLALLARGKGQYENALQWLDKALALAPPPARAEIHALRADVLERAGRHGEAVRACDEALALRPDRADTHAVRGQALLDEGRYAEAVQAFTRCLDCGGGANRAIARYAYPGRGLAYFRLGNYPAALGDYTLELAAEPSADLYQHRGWAYFFADAWKPALADFEEALRRDPRHAEARVGRGLCRALLGQYREAAADAEVVWQQPTKNSEMAYNLSCVFAQVAGRALADRSAPDGPALAARCRARAVEVLRTALSLKPPEQRLPFWKSVVLTDTALDPVRGSAEFKQLAAQVEAGQLR